MSGVVSYFIGELANRGQFLLRLFKIKLFSEFTD